MKKIFTILILLIATNSYAQKKYTISGYITDKNNGESIVGVNIYCADLSLGVTSNTYGFYSLTPPEGISVGLFWQIFRSQFRAFLKNY